MVRKKIELSMKELRKTQDIRKKINSNENKIRKLLSDNHNLHNQLVRTCFKLDTKGREQN